MQSFRLEQLQTTHGGNPQRQWHWNWNVTLLTHCPFAFTPTSTRPFIDATLWLAMNTNLTWHIEGATHYESYFSLHSPLPRGKCIQLPHQNTSSSTAEKRFAEHCQIKLERTYTQKWGLVKCLGCPFRKRVFLQGSEILWLPQVWQLIINTHLRLLVVCN